VNDAVTALSSALSSFNTARNDGTKTEILAANKVALTSAISAANTAKDGVVPDTVAANVPVGTKWVTQTEMSALTNAIASAETVKNNASATQTEVDTATTALANATSAFTTAKKDGTKTETIAAEKTALTTAISAANTAKTGVVTSADGKDQTPGTKWVTDTVMTALTTALSAAETANGDANATQTQVDAALAALNTAKDAFNPATASTSKTALSTAIEQANSAKANVVVNTAAANVPVGTKWVPDTVMNAFTNAISTAETVNNNASATQTAVDNAVTALNSAVSAFNATKGDGTKTTGTAPISVNFWQNENDGAIFASSDNIPITTILEFTATVTSAYTTVQWYIDGAPASSATTASITINGAAYIGDLGIHRLSVVVIKGSAYYSKEITFTVTL
jgi:hypothetical protein